MDAQPGAGLPRPLTPFVGRRAELDALAGLLRRAEARLITLSGPGGVGKSRLAQQAAGAAADAFPDGVCRVDLGAVAPELALAALARAVAAPAAPGLGPAEQLHAALATRRLLLLLDNFERPGPAAAALGALLAAAPRLCVLATRRVPLGAAGEHELPVAPLAAPPADARPTMAEALAYDGVRLLVALAREAHPDFQPTDADAPALAALCRRLDGLPLALELSAGQLGLLGPRAMLERVERRAAAGRLGAAPGPPEALGDAIALGYEQLDPPARELLRHLSVFVGGAAVDAVERVCGPAAARPDALLDALDELVRRHMARRTGDGPDGPRVSVLETIRRFGQDRLAAHGELAALQRRHAEHFLGLAEAAAAALGGPAQRPWLDRLEREHENLRAALAWALQPQADLELGLRLAAALARFWVLRGHLAEGRAQLARLLADSAAPPAFAAAAPRPLRLARARALLAAGQLAHHQRDAAASAAAFAAALELCRELGLDDGAAHALRGLGNVAVEQGRLDEAGARYAESLALAEGLGLAELLGPLLNNLGLVALYAGDDGRAAALMERSMAVYRGLGDDDRVSALLSNLGALALRAGDLPLAAARLRESLELAAALGDGWGRAHCLGRVAELALAARRPERAAWLLGAAEGYPGYGERLDQADRAAHARLVGGLRAGLDAPALATARAAGRAATPQEAAAAALALLGEL